MADLVAVVSGAGGTIGAACARALASGRDLVLCADLDARRAERTAHAITAAGSRADVVVADASGGAFADTVVRSVPNGSIVTAAVHAIAHEEHVPAVDVTDDSMRRSFTMGPLAAFTLFRELLRRGHVTRGSALTAIGSLHSRYPFVNCLGYNAGHGALAQVVRTLAHEWADKGVRVNAVVPGWIRTDGETAFYGDEHLDRVASRLPFGRFGSAEDIANAVHYLSSEAASYISGSFLTVDGALAVSLARLPDGGDA